LAIASCLCSGVIARTSSVCQLRLLGRLAELMFEHAQRRPPGVRIAVAEVRLQRSDRCRHEFLQRRFPCHQAGLM
jgi:hypothetical protein